MEVVAATPNGNGVSPFHNHDVREWSRIDSLTGILERARLETDHWTASTNNTSHKYGKVVDSRARSGADGSLQQQARRQLEVFQSQIPGGRLQVIKTQTVSSSRWTNNSNVNNKSAIIDSRDFEGLQLPLNPLDLTSEKSKASVGRSVARRPPSRSRPREEFSLNATSDTQRSSAKLFHQNLHNTASTNLNRVSRLCHQIHETACRETFGNNCFQRRSSPQLQQQQQQQRRNRLPQRKLAEKRENGDGGSETDRTIDETRLTREKSTSSDDLFANQTNDSDNKTKSIEDLEDLEQLRSWRRTSKIRRSLQFPKSNPNKASRPPDLPPNTGSVRKIREDLETGRRLNTALRGNNVDLEALDQILQSISSSSSVYSDQNEQQQQQQQEPEKKRNSFVTVETLKEVKGRLRRTSFPSSSDVYGMKKDEENDEERDDGIVTEDSVNEPLPTPSSRVKSYIYGMETLNGSTPLTGSLESRSKHVAGNNVSNRNEDWYNRRKSYGFEQMQTHQEPPNIISSMIKGKAESSTDSGICRSSEIVQTKTDLDETSSNINTGNVKKFSTLFEQNNTKNWTKNGDLESTTIRIPIGNRPSTNTAWIKPEENNKRHSIAVDEYKYVNKRAIDDSKYRRTSLAVNDTSTSSTAFYQQEDGDEMANGRRTKKVEFCKTEVHFTPESGRVNIVETDEKPPPTQNFRRRRRNGGLNETTFAANGNLPVLHFGDTSYEKNLYVTNNNGGNSEETLYENLIPRKELVSCSTVTINNNAETTTTSSTTTATNGNNVRSSTTNRHVEEASIKEDSDIIKGILKNKPIKPKQYILGEPQKHDDNNEDDDHDNNNSLWGIKLKHVHRDEQKPIWRSTVTVRNTFYDLTNNNSNAQEEERQQQPPQRPEFQKLLKSLRPTTTTTSSPTRTNENPPSERITSSKEDETALRRSSWSVADRVKQVEDLQWTENKGYSTKVTIGEGDAIVVENLTENERHHQQQTQQQQHRHPTWPRKDDSLKGTASRVEKLEETTRQREKTVKNVARSKSSPIREKYSPSLMRKYGNHNENLWSPSMVNKNAIIKQDAPVAESTKATVHKNEVLRVPKKSEMAYFGVQISPKPVKKSLQTKRQSPKKSFEEATYENVEILKKEYNKNDFDSSILEELTKAADQIMQAVNSYADGDDCGNRSGTTEDEEKCNRREPLDTISETRSWKNTTKTQNTRSTTRTKDSTTKSKLKSTSSNSSIESFTRECRKSTTSVKPNEKSFEKQSRKKTANNESATNNTHNVKALTRARRLQRASSREALLQSHGSSSEDLPATSALELRKPRLIKRTKTAQLTITNGLDMKKRSSRNVIVSKPTDETENKEQEKYRAVREIRHKTAVSTIKSTAEKAASRERTRSKATEETRRKPLKKETVKVPAVGLKSERNRSVTPKETIINNNHHRTTSAAITKKSAPSKAPSSSARS